MGALSTTSIARQVTREGRRWGLVPEVVGDAVKVCDMQHEAEAHHGLGEVTKKPRRLCTVDEEHPFSGVLHNRVSNGETNMARRYQLADELEAKARQKAADELDDEIRREWATRRRVTIGPRGLYIPAGLAERHAFRRRGGR